MEITPLTEELFESYIKIGTKAYNQHYLHLWKNQDSTPYIESSFTPKVLRKELADDTTELFSIAYNNLPVGVLKINKNIPLEPYSAEDALLLEKIYILKEYTGKGLGKEVLDFTERRARDLRKQVIWLDTMQNSPALHFYLAYGFQIHSETRLHFKTVLDGERPMYNLVKQL